MGGFLCRAGYVPERFDFSRLVRFKNFLIQFFPAVFYLGVLDEVGFPLVKGFCPVVGLVFGSVLPVLVCDGGGDLVYPIQVLDHADNDRFLLNFLSE